MMSSPQKEHEILQQLVGNWTYESTCYMGPDKPADTHRGTETVRSLGGLWVVGEGKATMPGGGEGTMIITLGYDVDAKKYVGTWIGSMMSRLWVYDVEVEGNTINMYADGPSFDDPKKIVRYRDAIEIKSRDHRVFTASARQDDGSWMTFMTAPYQRVK